MEITFSAALRPRPVFRQCGFPLRASFVNGVRVVHVIGYIRSPKCLFRNIAPDILLYSAMCGQSRPADPQTLKRHLRHWLLVLEAKGIPFVSCRFKSHCAVYVPVTCAAIAVNEINEYQAEGYREACYLPARPCWWAGCAVVLALLVWHLLRFDALSFYTLPTPPFPRLASDWIQAFGLDVYRTKTMGELWRLVTSLTLHIDTRHLLGNSVLTAVFFSMLSGRAGVGAAVFLTVWGGLLGNGCTLFFKAAHTISIGFSTASFAIIGALGAYVFCDIIHLRRFSGGLQLLHASPWFTPVAAVIGFLAMWGGAGQEQTNFLAHCMGLLMGFLLACPVWFTERQLLGKRFASLCRVASLIFLGIGVIGYSWLRAIA